MQEILYKISAEQFALIDSWGGRNENDLCVDSNGLYIIMTDGHQGQIKVYLDKQKLNDKKVELENKINRLTKNLC